MFRVQTKHNFHSEGKFIMPSTISKTRYLTTAAVLAAAYAALTMCLPALSFNVVQLRFSEVLTVLPFLFPAAMPGVAIGCLIANLLSPYGLVDIVCGTAATALAAVWTSKVKTKWLAPMPPVLCNLVIIGAMLAWYETGFGPAFWPVFAFNALTVGLGQLIICYGLGLPLLVALPKIPVLRAQMPALNR